MIASRVMPVWERTGSTRLLADLVPLVTTQCPHGGVHLGRYAVSQGLLSVGAVSGGDFTSDALVAWVTDLLSQGLSPEQVREAIKQQTHTH